MTDYKIGEVARLLGLTTQALRFYEQEGVVTPKKSENGTRYYDEDQLILLLSFKKYRQADFSVQDIVTHFFKEDDLSGLRGQTLARRDMLLEQSALLRRAHVQQENRLEIGDLVLVRDEMAAYVRGEEVKILPREFQVLYKLLSHPKKIFTRSELLDDYWGMTNETGLRTVDVVHHQAAQGVRPLPELRNRYGAWLWL